ncbi:hypothetical protein D3C77_800570 [compost metagenome]
MGALQRRDDAFHARQGHERVEAFLIGRGLIVHPAEILQIAVLRADTGVVQPGRDGVHG